MKSGKIVKISACVAAGLAVVILAAVMLGNSAVRESNAVPQSGETSYEESYQAYLSEAGYEGTLSQEVIEVDLEDYETSQDMEIGRAHV